MMAHWSDPFPESGDPEEMQLQVWDRLQTMCAGWDPLETGDRSRCSSAACRLSLFCPIAECQRALQWGAGPDGPATTARH
jgi:hypothetical protein